MDGWMGRRARDGLAPLTHSPCLSFSKGGAEGQCASIEIYESGVSI